MSLLALAGSLMLFVPETHGYNRYNDGCQTCHGAFTDATSTKGSTFFSNSKHEMHRSSDVSAMNTDCNMCHTSGDQKNPYTSSSNEDGFGNAPGLGCSGCHNPAGLRLHHDTSGVSTCGNCHTADGTPDNESIAPPYYNTPGTRAMAPCNSEEQPRLNENWTLADFVGLDNDGDGAYDGADSDCSGPAGAGRVGSASLSVTLDSNGDVVLTWGASCMAGDTDYGVYEGELLPIGPTRTFEGHTPVSCGVGGGTSYTFTPAATMQYYLVVPSNGSVEGSHGLNHLDPPNGPMAERPVGAATCSTQVVGGCS